MYNLDINLLKNRPEYQQKVGSQANQLSWQLGEFTPVYVGVAVGLLFPTLMFFSLSFLQWKTAEVAKQTTKLEEQGKGLNQTIANIKKMKAETATINSQTTTLVKVFDQIRPWSAILHDLGDRIPTRVQIESIKQTSPNPQPIANTTPSNTAG
ncbi:MAG: PilN domain-containing protein [Dolichospermum sp.]